MVKQQQKLEKRNTYTPTSASQACGSVVLSLNKEETLGEQDLKTFFNNLDVNHQQHRAGRNLRVSDIVYVINMRGEPLMPTKHKKAKKLLKENKAKVVKRLPFTIQLTTATGEAKQKITLGIDTGAKFIGFSAVSKKKELISGEVKLDNMMSKRLSDRRMYRKNKRNRLWHREPRFDNRSSSKKKGWLPPSVQRKYNTHLSLIGKIKDILPVSDVIIEVGNFDIQKLQDPMINGVGYQQGLLYQYRNRIAYLLAREKEICQYCGKAYKKNDPWRLHHIWGKHKDRSEDWALLHKECHLKLHRLKQEYVLRKKKSKSYKASTFMNIIKGRFQNDIDCELTFGYKTFTDRHDIGLEKSHINDAFIISGGIAQERLQSFKVIQKRKNNRCLQKNRKGFAPAIRRQRYFYQPNDMVKFDGKKYLIKGSHCNGSRVVLENKKSVSVKKISLISRRQNWFKEINNVEEKYVKNKKQK